ncbi:Hypothetical predicted protein [Olea europaea subsp. europaea]|uniref:Uncharacterized protein n=1 Tax=Olea europaea subsp. europaea TaxID=158383 RepID=A0A8S0TE82_OLEEU|nr:Hypothetical predicted protein [Olea europaea subsp. europaea]
MVVMMIKWRPWPPLISRKFEVKLRVQRLEAAGGGGDWVLKGTEKDKSGVAVEIRWNGPKISLGSFRRTVKRNCTSEESGKRVDGPNGGVLWCGMKSFRRNVIFLGTSKTYFIHGGCL